MITLVEILRTRLNRHEASGLPTDQQLVTAGELRELLDMLDRSYVAVDEQQGRVAVHRGHKGIAAQHIRAALAVLTGDTQ